jgi:hypothetical protein
MGGMVGGVSLYLFVSLFYDTASGTEAMEIAYCLLSHVTDLLLISSPESEYNPYGETMTILTAWTYEAVPWRSFFLVATLLFVTVVANNTFTFPQNFSFATATSSYQVEGAWNEDGKSRGQSVKMSALARRFLAPNCRLLCERLC